MARCCRAARRAPRAAAGLGSLPDRRAQPGLQGLAVCQAHDRQELAVLSGKVPAGGRLPLLGGPLQLRDPESPLRRRCQSGRGRCARKSTDAHTRRGCSTNRHGCFAVLGSKIDGPDIAWGAVNCNKHHVACGAGNVRGPHPQVRKPPHTHTPTPMRHTPHTHAHTLTHTHTLTLTHTRTHTQTLTHTHSHTHTHTHSHSHTHSFSHPPPPSSTREAHPNGRLIVIMICGGRRRQVRWFSDSATQNGTLFSGGPALCRAHPCPAPTAPPALWLCSGRRADVCVRRCCGVWCAGGGQARRCSRTGRRSIFLAGWKSRTVSPKNKRAL